MTNKILLSHLPDEIIINNEVVLRAFDLKYWDELKKVVRDNNVHLGRRLLWARDHDLETNFRDVFEDILTKKATNEQAHWYIFIDGKLCGSVNLRKDKPDEELLEIGYWLILPHTGKGIVTTCVKLITDLAFETTNTPAIEISFNKNNFKSINVAKRAGYIFDREIIQDNKILFDQYYRLTREEWEKNH